MPDRPADIVSPTDHQIGLMTGMRDTTSLAELKSNVIGLARTAKALNIPTAVTIGTCCALPTLSMLNGR